MNKQLLLAIPFAVGLAFAGSVSAQTGECDAAGPKVDTADCEPLTRAEVKAEVEKVGAATTGVGECPDVAAGPTKAGMVRTRAEVRKEAQEAVATGKAIDLGECPR